MLYTYINMTILLDWQSLDCRLDTLQEKDLMVWTEDEILHIQLNGINWKEAF